MIHCVGNPRIALTIHPCIRTTEKQRMATQAVTDHVELAKDFLERSKSYLALGDLHQASEKGWGAASHIVKAVAAANNWQYESHDEFESVVVNARQRYRQPGLLEMSRAAEALHRNYYRRALLLNAEVIRRDVESVKKLVNILQPFIV